MKFDSTGKRRILEVWAPKVEPEEGRASIEITGTDVSVNQMYNIIEGLIEDFFSKLYVEDVGPISIMLAQTLAKAVVDRRQELHAAYDKSKN